MAVGVPLMAPVEVLKERPVGRVAEIDHETTAPPLLPGVYSPSQLVDAVSTTLGLGVSFFGGV